MTINKQWMLREGRMLLIFILIGIVQGYFTCYRCTTPRSLLMSMTFTFLMWMFLWKGNEALTAFVSARISWIEFPVKRFVVGMLATMTYSLAIVVGLLTLFEIVGGINFGAAYSYTVFISLIITILISLFLHSRSFLLHWRTAALEKEQYEKESIAAKYEILKSQVNPHFLFNSLNALTNLVYEDQAKAVKFIKQLSEIYRYVLETREKEVVSLDEELRFLESYIFLQQIRFGEKLRFTVTIGNSNATITPLALQLLIENAIKHNVIAEDAPLHIQLYKEGDFICVENNLQKKAVLREPFQGLGLENIRRRYQILTDREVEIIERGNIFKVKLPLLN